MLQSATADVKWQLWPVAAKGISAVALAVSIEHQGDTCAPQTVDRLAAMQALVHDDLAAVNCLIIERMQSPVSLIPHLAGHITASGGKRLRPIVTLLASRLCGYEGERHQTLAACVEFIHTATLLHDDVVDASDLRRGTATANAIWGNEASVLVGDFLFSRAFQLMVEDGSLEVLAILSGASAVIAEGEVMQLLTSNDTSTSETDYLAVITAKTARLFAAAAEIGAVVCESTAEQRQALYDYGEALGMSFQLVDDALDYTAAQATLGKTIGDDFRQGKITLPVVLAFARGNERERSFWRRTLEDGGYRNSDLSQAIDLLDKYNAVADTLTRAKKYAERARAALDGFPDNAYRSALGDAADFAVERAY